ncbi:hypothetical protein G6F31_021857 [Rhizopus arrhizus]|nr:hypothetical protein G6F31_021857 [Rhizopus arrhizus]
MRQRTAQERDFAQARHGHVGHEIALAVQMARVLLARHPRAHSLRLTWPAVRTGVFCRHDYPLSPAGYLGWAVAPAA